MHLSITGYGQRYAAREKCGVGLPGRGLSGGNRKPPGAGGARAGSPARTRPGPSSSRFSRATFESVTPGAPAKLPPETPAPPEAPPDLMEKTAKTGGKALLTKRSLLQGSSLYSRSKSLSPQQDRAKPGMLTGLPRSPDF